jgi:hypothetical protein
MILTHERMVVMLSFFSKAIEEKYRPVIMWFWNDRIDSGKMKEQIRELKRQGFMQFFIHPMFLMSPRYLSDEFFELIRDAVECASELGMKVWIYDEYNWPSGVAGGKILRESPEHRSTIVKHFRETLLPGNSADIALEKDSQVISVCIVADDSEWVDVSCHVEEIEQEGFSCIRWMNTESKTVVLHVFVRCLQRGVLSATQWSIDFGAEEGYLDTSNLDAVKEFLKVTHERYAEYVGDEFGKTVQGVFTDEPCITSPYGIHGNCIPWTRGFAKKFYEMHGYDLRNRMIQLVERIGDYRKVRYDFWHALVKQFSKSYFKTVSKWCKAHNLILTGHNSGEEFLISTLLQSGDFFECMKHFDWPGIDSIFSKKRIDLPEFDVAGRLIAAVARHTGKQHILCETYTGSGWSLDFNDMKRIYNRLAFLGVDILQFMAAYYSIEGPRKRLPIGYPPAHSFQNPLWKYYGQFGDYVAKVSQIVSESQPEYEVGVLYPRSTVWAEYDFSVGWQDRFKIPYDHPISIADGTFRTLLSTLAASNIDYSCVFEQSLEGATVVDGKILIGPDAYSVLLIPSMTVISSKAELKLREFILSSGTVIFVNALPIQMFQDKTDLAHSVGLDHQISMDCVCELLSMNEPIARLITGRGTNVYWLVTNDISGKSSPLLASRLCEISKLADERNQFSVPEGVYVSRREHKGGLFFFVNNDSPTAKTVGIKRELIGRSLFIYYPDSQNTAVLPQDNKGADDFIEFELNPFQIAFVYPMQEEHELTETSKDTLSISFQHETKREIALDGEWTFAVSGLNYLPLDIALCRGDSQSLKKLEPGSHLPIGFGLEPGVVYEFEAAFEVHDKPKDLRVLIEKDAMLVYLTLNGEPIQEFYDEQGWDDGIIGCFIVDVVKLGLNVIRGKAKVAGFSAPHTIPFIVVAGQFSIDETGRICSYPATIRPAPWTQQGFPFYAGEGTYATQVQLGCLTDVTVTKLDLGEVRSVAEVKINRSIVGRRLWKPYEFNISDSIVNGTNLIEIRIASTLSPLFEGNYIDVSKRKGQLKRTLDSYAGMISIPKLVLI